MTSFSILPASADVTETERLVADFTHGAARMLLDLAYVPGETEDDEPHEAYAEAWHSPAYGWELEPFSVDARKRIEERCEAFILANLADVAEAAAHPYNERWHGADSVGQDYVLTAERHGAGFWDRDMGALGDRLTAAAEADGAFRAGHSEDATVGDVELMEG